MAVAWFGGGGGGGGGNSFATYWFKLITLKHLDLGGSLG